MFHPERERERQDTDSDKRLKSVDKFDDDK